MGAQLVDSCAACHGVDGNSISTDWPKLSGQNQRYLYEQLKYFRDGARMNALMMSVTPYLQTLSDDDLNISLLFILNITAQLDRPKMMKSFWH